MMLTYMAAGYRKIAYFDIRIKQATNPITSDIIIDTIEINTVMYKPCKRYGNASSITFSDVSKRTPLFYNFTCYKFNVYSKSLCKLLFTKPFSMNFIEFSIFFNSL